MTNLSAKAQSFSIERYHHHHQKWVETGSPNHLYALRAHLKNLGWLAAAHDRPGLGVR